MDAANTIAKRDLTVPALMVKELAVLSTNNDLIPEENRHTPYIAKMIYLVLTVLRTNCG